LSGIYGIYRYDGAPVDPAWLERMRTAMGYYGPDGGGCRIAGPVGVGHLLLVTNPEDAYEQQPVAGARGPVVASARLDNREELLTAFGVAPSDAQRVPDGHSVRICKGTGRWPPGIRASDASCWPETPAGTPLSIITRARAISLSQQVSKLYWFSPA